MEDPDEYLCRNNGRAMPVDDDVARLGFGVTMDRTDAVPSEWPLYVLDSSSTVEKPELDSMLGRCGTSS